FSFAQCPQLFASIPNFEAWDRIGQIRQVADLLVNRCVIVCCDVLLLIEIRIETSAAPRVWAIGDATVRRRYRCRTFYCCLLTGAFFAGLLGCMRAWPLSVDRYSNCEQNYRNQENCC